MTQFAQMAMGCVVTIAVLVAAGTVTAMPGSSGYSYSAPTVLPQQYGPPPPPAPAAPIIMKHVYVHVPPPEPAHYSVRKPIAVPPAQKHYKIVFIKAPAPPVPIVPIIPLQPQNEEKTLVYVLVKKPDEQPDIILPTPAPTDPSKPEVYFIRYKSETKSGYPNSKVPSSEYGVPAVAAASSGGIVTPSLEYGL